MRKTHHARLGASLVVLAGLVFWSASYAQQSGPSPADRVRPLIERVERAMPGLADHGAGAFALARLYAQAGQSEKALALLKECLTTGHGFDPSGSDMLAPLRTNAEFRQLTERVHQRYPAVHHSSLAFTVPERDLFPEGLSYDPAKHVFYLGSMYRRKIVMITENGAVSDFVKPGQQIQPIGGVHVDPADGSLWAASDPDDARGSELYHFDAKGNLLERYSPPGAGPHDLNDLVLSGSAAIYVTDTEANLTYRFDRKTHAFTTLDVGREQVFPNGITLSADGSRLYIADWLGVTMIDLHDNSHHDVVPGNFDTVSGVDGLYWYEGGLVGVQSAGTFRVMRWALSTDGWHVRGAKVLERGTTMVSFPTTGAIRGSEFYYIANTGLDQYNDGKIGDASKLEAVRIARVALK